MLNAHSSIHNIFVVIPQFLVTGFSSIIFAILAPHRSVITPSSSDSPPALFKRDESEEWDVFGIIFRTGGISSAVAAWIVYYYIWRDRHRRSRSDSVS